MTITWDEFLHADLRVGKIVRAEEFSQAIKPAYKLWIDLGEYGVKRSSAQITDHYTVTDLVGQQVLCVCNFPPKQIGPFMSEVLVTGVTMSDGTVTLVRPDAVVPNGSRLS